MIFVCSATHKTKVSVMHFRKRDTVVEIVHLECNLIDEV